MLAKSWLAHLAVVFGVITLSICSCAFPVRAFQTTARELLASFIESLNSREETKLRDFLTKHASSDVPIEQRVLRLKSLADSGAPFKIAGQVTEEPRSVRALVEDRNGEKLGFAMDVQRSPELRMLALRVGPPDMLDSPAPKDYTGWKDLSSLGASIRSDTRSPAIAIAVLRDGKLEQTVSGVREAGGNDPVLVDDPWSLGSIGKPVCTTVIGRLVEMGRLRWDLTLGEGLAGLPMKPGYKAVTLEQIMHHRGGIPEDLGFTQDRVTRLVAGAADPMKMRENYARDILNRDPIAAPGARFAYSNAGFALLGIVAERAMRKPYETLVRELVFEPLGLKHSYTGTDTLPSPRPSGHVPGSGGLQKRNLSGPLEILVAPAGGGLYMSAGDLARFGAEHLKGLRGEDGLLKAATIRHLHQGIPEEPGGRQYACGWGIDNLPGIGIMHTHNGSNGTFRSQLSVFPEANLVVASFVNSGGEAEPSPPLQAVQAIAKRYATGARQ